MPQNKLHFTISERKLYLRFFDNAFVLLGLLLINYFFDFQYVDFPNPNSLIWILLLVFYLLLFGEIFEMYNLKVASDRYLTLRSTFITVVFVTLFYVFTPILSPELPQNRIQIGYFAITLLTSILINRFIYIQFIFSPRFLKNILIIADTEQVEKIISINQNKGTNKIVAYVSNKTLGSPNLLVYEAFETVNLEQTVKDNYINEIIVSSSSLQFITNTLNTQLIELFEKGMMIRSIDSFIEEETNRISESQLKQDFYNYFSFSKSHQNNLYLAFRRGFDIFFSLIGIMFFLLLIPFVLIANVIGNRGKLLYFQKRVGKKGKLFNIIKFRTMISNAEENGVEWSKKGDARITAFGRILRKTRLDEVPQFLNVLKGEMSLIGPRPERPEFVKMLETEIPFYAIRHVIKPGLTGWAQVMHPYASTVEDQHKKLMYDLYYIKERNILLDFKIVIKTISTILFFRGT
ncbi:exopolysaccharide biosynthesis polyprenyl glycosylphosphotransferase [Lutibacter sp.]